MAISCPIRPPADAKGGPNPPGARTRHEPKRVVYKDDESAYQYRSPRLVPVADTPALRAEIQAKSQVLADAHAAYIKALADFNKLGPLPDSVIKDLSLGIKRHMRLYQQTKS